MLVLTRNVGESIIIDGGIKIKVNRVNGMQVSIGIEAPKHVKVNREEIHEKIVQGIPKPK